MEGKKKMETEGTNNSEVEIQVPPVSGEFKQGSQEDLLALQDQMFKKKEKEEAPQKEPVKKKKQTAQEIFRKTQEVNKKIETQEKERSDEATEAEATFDSSKFLPGATEDTPEDKGEVEDEAGTDEVEEEAEEPEAVALDKETNLKNLRQIAGNFKKERDTYRAKIQELEGKLKTAPSEGALTTKISELEARVQQLEPYEFVYALQNNPVYRQKYIEPANQIVSEMKQIVADYGAGEEVVEDIIGIKNRKDLDEVLEQNFASSSARTDLKALKQKFDGLEKEREQFEKEPKKALQSFEAERATNEAKINQQRDAHLNALMGPAWQAALNAVRELPDEQKIYELIEQPGKKDHNEKVVAPTLESAQALTKMGLQYVEQVARTKGVVSPQFAQWFAQICQQAAATQMVNAVRWGIHKKYEELLRGQSKQNSFDRPGISPKAKTTSKQKGKKKSPQEISAGIFQEVVFGGED